MIAREAICADGTSRALGAGERASADEALTDALAATRPAASRATVVSVDLFYDGDERARGTRDAVAVEMEAAALFAKGAAPAIPSRACWRSRTPSTRARDALASTKSRCSSAAETMGRAAIAALSA